MSTLAIFQQYRSLEIKHIKLLNTRKWSIRTKLILKSVMIVRPFLVIKLSSTINVIILPNYPIGKLYLLEVKVKGYGV